MRESKGVQRGRSASIADAADGRETAQAADDANLIQTPSPMLSQVEGEQLELAADMSKFAGADADADACEDKQPDGRG